MSSVPEGWKQLTLSQLGQWRGGGTPSKANPDFWRAGDIPWVSPKDVKAAKLFETDDYITAAAVRESSTSLIPAHSILVVTRSGILRHSVPVAINSVPMAINQDIKALRPSQGFDTNFIANVLWLNDQAILLNCAKDGTTVESIDFSALKKFTVAVPPLPEQQKIAETLSTWDEAIEKLEHLIAAKRERKRGLMQVLLTGKKRFKEFEGLEWSRQPFESLFRSVSGKKYQIQKSEYAESGTFPIVDQGQPRIAGYTNANKAFRNVPVIIFGDHTRIIKWVDIPFVVGADGTQLLKTTPDIDLKFGFYLLQSARIPALGYSRHFKILKETVFSVPDSKEEQREIASVFSTADAEIENLQEQLEAYKQQKRGLMQVLLTGKKRVRV